jgi:hypothetical protein
MMIFWCSSNWLFFCLMKSTLCFCTSVEFICLYTFFRTLSQFFGKITFCDNGHILAR